MKKIIYSIILLLGFINVVHAQALYDCADSGASYCTDTTKTATGFDPNIPAKGQCIDACNSQATSIGNSMNAGHANGGKWVCVSTKSSVVSVGRDPHGNARMICECGISCVKGQVNPAILNVDDQVIIEDF